MDNSPPSSSWDSPGKNTGVGCHALLQRIFLTQGLKLCLLHLQQWQADSLPQAPSGKPEDKHKRLERRSTSILYEHSIVLNLTHPFSKKKKSSSQTYIFNKSFLAGQHLGLLLPISRRCLKESGKLLLFYDTSKSLAHYKLAVETAGKSHNMV